MIKSLLVANRGETACRVIRTARRVAGSTVSTPGERDRPAQRAS